MIRKYEIRYSNGHTSTLMAESRADALANATQFLGVYVNGIFEK